MAMVVQHNLTAMNSNRMLGITTGQQSKSSERLSSGYRINRAADDAAGLTISEKMRKQIRGLDRASTNAQDGISAVQTAEGALTEVHSMLQRMNELAVQASNGTNSEDDRQAIQDEIDQLVTEIDRVSETTKFNEIYLLKGDAGKPTTKTIGDYKYEMTQQAIDAQEVTFATVAGKDAYAGGETDAVTADVKAAEASITFSDQGAGANHLYVSADGTWGDTIEVTAANFSDYFDVDDDGNVTEKVAGAAYGVAAAAGGAAAGVKTAADLQNDGWLVTTAKTDAAEGSLSDYIEVVDGELKYKEGKVLYQTAADAAGNEYGVQVDTDKIAEADLGDYFTFASNPLVDKDGKEITDVSAYFKDGVYQGGIYRNTTGANPQLTEIGADQIEDWVKVTEPKTVSVNDDLEFNLHVGSESAIDNKIKVKIQSISAAGIGIDGLKETGLMTEDDATEAINTISDAIKVVSKQRSQLGAIQNRLEHTIANLDNVVENTTAAESRIRDTDMASEMVEYSKNNILAQAGQSMLAQANQSTQGVLSLLQ